MLARGLPPPASAQGGVTLNVFGGLGFRVLVGFRVQGLGFRVWGLGFTASESPAPPVVSGMLPSDFGAACLVPKVLGFCALWQEPHTLNPKPQAPQAVFGALDGSGAFFKVGPRVGPYSLFLGLVAQWYPFPFFFFWFKVPL